MSPGVHEINYLRIFTDLVACREPWVAENPVGFERCVRNIRERFRINNKWRRRRLRLKAEGRCAHCGKPCAPYNACAENRAYKRALYRKKHPIVKKAHRPEGDGPRMKRHERTEEWKAIKAGEALLKEAKRRLKQAKEG